MLLEKKRKSTEQLNIIRPITLTNYDVKLITKSFTNRMSKVMPEVIHRRFSICYRVVLGLVIPIKYTKEK